MSKRTKKETEEFVRPDDGKHTGSIVSVEEKQSKAGYDRIILQMTAEDEADGEPLYQYTDNEGTPQYATVICGFNDNYSSQSDFGKLVSRLKMDVEKGKDLEIQDLVGVNVSYMTNTEKGTTSEGEDAEFCNVMRETIKLA